jgi:hypothetical protein
MHIEKLRLKLIVHSGEALFHRVLNFQELAGVDVIIVHRLLKNSVQADQYLLMTEAAREDVQLPESALLTVGSEQYENIGRIGVAVYLTPGTEGVANRMPTTFSNRFVRSSNLMLKIWFRPLTGWRTDFHHLDSGVTRGRKLGFALFTILLTPIYVPVGMLFAVFHACRNARY